MLFLTTLAVCFVSAFIPVVNAEAYLTAVTLTQHHVLTIALALAATTGQMAGKCLWYAGGRYSLRWRWVRKHLDKPKRRAQYERWQHRMETRPVVSALMLFVSASTGFPPFAITSIVAGYLRMSLWLFVPIGFVGRFVRFGLIIAGASLIVW